MENHLQYTRRSFPSKCDIENDGADPERALEFNLHWTVGDEIK